MFVAAYENVTYALDVSAFCENTAIEFPGDFRLSDYLTPLNQLQGPFTESGVSGTLEVYLAAKSRGEQWVLVVEIFLRGA
jgi:hypothetical protein